MDFIKFFSNSAFQETVKRQARVGENICSLSDDVYQQFYFIKLEKIWTDALSKR